jgi:hypothetical protein
MKQQQLRLPVTTPAELREEEQFGRRDYQTGLARENLYSRQLTGERQVAYCRGYDEARRQAPWLWVET